MAKKSYLFIHNYRVYTGTTSYTMGIWSLVFTQRLPYIYDIAFILAVF